MIIRQVTFKWDETVWCTNMAKGVSEDQIREHYSKYEKVFLSTPSACEIEIARMKGMPFINCAKS